MEPSVHNCTRTGTDAATIKTTRDEASIRTTDEHTAAAIAVRLALLDLPISESLTEQAELVAPLLARQREQVRRLDAQFSPVDRRIQSFLDDYLNGQAARLPQRTFVLDQPGLARALSLPMSCDEFHSDLVGSYRLRNGILHNPANDRRTTAGVFHIAEGGLPIPDDKLAVPRTVFASLLDQALRPPADDLTLPFTSAADDPARCFVSLLLRPIVVPDVPGVCPERRMETRFIAPGGLVSNLDFVETIFGNGGDPYLPENDASLDPLTWTGHTGCVILAPHLIHLTKAALGLPHVDDATERQRRDGMCWSDQEERYNDGRAFKVCARDERGVMVTIIADNYFGYCKKEVKTQISYSANLFGYAEEEHAGGAQVFESYNEGQEYTDHSAGDDYTLADVIARDPDHFEPQSEGHALIRDLPHVIMVPEHATYSLRTQTVSWGPGDDRRSIKLRADKVYMGPSGFTMTMIRIKTDGNQWSLIGTYGDATVCHKPSTVSGGGKSEISKAITDAIIVGNAYVANFDDDMAQVDDILNRDFSQRFTDPQRNGVDTRKILDDERSVGSVIKLLTPSSRYREDYNEWLNSIPQHVVELVFVVKRFYHPKWGSDWRSHFTVGIINGRPGVSLRLDGDKIMVNTLRVGFSPDGSWRIFGLRHDFAPAVKVQTEDDITASVVIADDDGAVYKYVANCERYLFQRPDDAIHRGYDKQAEADIAQRGTFLSNFQPLTGDDAVEMRDDAIAFSMFTEPMRCLIDDAVTDEDWQAPEFFVSSANPRLVDGHPSKNPRYLQLRPDLARPADTATSALSQQLFHKVSVSQPVPRPVDVIVAGRRNNPPEDGIPPLCAYNPLHYMEMPELLMEFISSMTGKSPSTTGAGSEGAMTKGPFNALPATIDLNAALLSYVLGDYDGWISSAGCVGPRVRVDHDISMLIPEVFCRMAPAERSAKALIAGGFLEPIADITVDGELIEASRLGYRMTQAFAIEYFGRIFMHPHAVFTPEMLHPELQDEGIFAESVRTIVSTHERVAQAYFRDGTVDLAVPPIRALLEIMAYGKTADGYGLDSAEFRGMFDREAVLASDWYAERLDAQQRADLRRAEDGVAALSDFLTKGGTERTVERLGLRERMRAVEAELEWTASADYRATLGGCLGRQVRFC